MKQCNWCGAELEDDARACNNCGRPVPDMPEKSAPKKTVSEKQDGLNTSDLQKQQMQEDPRGQQDGYPAWDAPKQQDSWNRQNTQDPWDRQNARDPWNRQNQQDPWNPQNAQDPWNRQNTQDPWNRQDAQDPWNRQNQQDPWNRQNTQDPWNRQNTQDPWGQNTSPQQPYGGWQQVPPNGQPDYSGYNRQPMPGYAPQQQMGLRKYNTYAVWALVCGILASFLNGLVFVPSILAIIFGIVALVQTSRNTQLYKGRWMAVVGLACGVLFLIVYGYVFHMIFQAVQNPETLEQLQQYLKEISNTR